MAATAQEYAKAIVSLRVGLEYLETRTDELERQIARDAVIQRFEFCVELAWKVAAKLLGLQVTAARPAVRAMAQNGLIDDPVLWFDFIEARNKSSHTYNELIAEEVLAAARRFLGEGQKLLLSMETL